MNHSNRHYWREKKKLSDPVRSKVYFVTPRHETLKPATGSSSSKESPETWEHVEGVTGVFEELSKKEEMTIKSLRKYVEKADEDTKKQKIVQDVQKWIDIVDNKDSTVKEKMAADTKLRDLLEYLSRRKATLEETQEKLLDVKRGEEDLPDYIRGLWNKTSDTFSNCAERFNDASPQAKLVMVAGVVISFMALKMIFDKRGGKWGRRIGFLAGVFGGYHLLNKASEHFVGRPLINLKGEKEGGLFPAFTATQEQWDNAKRLQKLEDEWYRLSKMPIGVDKFVAGFTETEREKQKYAYAITNFCALPVKDLKKLYENTQDSKAVPDGKMPQYPFYDDPLSPIERFAVLAQIVSAMNFINVKAGKLDWKWTPKEEQAYKTKSTLYVVMEQLSKAKTSTGADDGPGGGGLKDETGGNRREASESGGGAETTPEGGSGGEKQKSGGKGGRETEGGTGGTETETEGGTGGTSLEAGEGGVRS